MITVGALVVQDYKPWISGKYRPGLISGMIDNTLSTGATSGLGRYAAVVESTLDFIPTTHLAKAADPSPWTGTFNASYQPLTFYFSATVAFQKSHFTSNPISASLTTPAALGTIVAPWMPTAEPMRSILISDPQVDNWRWSSAGLGKAIAPTLLHEFGHSVDFSGRWVTDGVWATEADSALNPMITLRSEWQSVYASVMAKSPSFGGAPWLADYYRTSITEWFAELYMVRAATNLAAGETYAYCSTESGAAVRCHPYLLKLMCGGDASLYSSMMQLFSITFPALSNPSPAWDGWGAPS